MTPISWPARVWLLLLAGGVCLAAGATPHTFDVCSDYECGRRQAVSLSDAQWDQVAALFRPAATGPVQERATIRRAVALLERLVGPLAGTAGDLGGNEAGVGKPGQMDCIDESTNTTTYLRLMATAGLLHWHTVEPRVRRAPWIFDVHWGAVIRERGSGKRFAVDSWFLDNGEPPLVQPLDAWLAKRPPADDAGARAARVVVP
jgi:hypothetical protein